MKLLSEVAQASTQATLKTSDGSDAGKNDTSSKTGDISFSLMRNVINTNGNVTGSSVNDYLERAHDLNDEVDSVGFAVEVDDELIKIYVNATQADAFEQELSKLLGLDDDAEAAINQLAQRFDIIDVVWPTDPEAGAAEDPYATASIDDDPSAFLDPEASPEGPALPADDEDEVTTADDNADASKEEPANDDDELMRDVNARAEAPREKDDAETDDQPPAESEPEDEVAAAAAAADDEADDHPADDEADQPADDEDTPADDQAADVDAENDDADDLDADGNPVKRRKAKKKPEVTEEGLRADVAAHVQARLAKGRRGQYKIRGLATGGHRGRREFDYTRDGQVVYFENREEAAQVARTLAKQRNVAGAKAHFSYTPQLIEDDMTSIGNRFLERLLEADEVKLDTPWTGLHNRLKRPYEKKIIELFALVGIPGRYAANIDGIMDAVQQGGDVLRRPGRKQTLFNRLFDLFKGPAAVTEAKKRGGRMQKILEAVLIRLGLPSELATTDGAGALASVFARAANKVEANADLQDALLQFARTLGVTAVEINEALSKDDERSILKDFEEWSGGFTPDECTNKEKRQYAYGAADARHDARSVLDFLTSYKKPANESVGERFRARMVEDVDVGNDEFMQKVVALATALGVPERNLQVQRAVLVRSLREKKLSLGNRGMIEQRMDQLIALLAKSTRQPATNGLTEAMANGLLMEAFGPLEALTDASLKHFHLEEPAAGPAMLAGYEGGGAHEETSLFVGVDPEVENDAKSLCVAIDGPWDGRIHAKYFANTKDGYKAALDYANMLRTANLKTGGRPKGWKD